MSDLHQVVDFGSALDHGTTKSRPVHCGISTDFDIIFDHHDADLRNLDTLDSSAGVAETIAANHHSGMQNHAVAQLTTFANDHIRMQHAVGTDHRIRTHKDAREYDRAMAELRVGPNPRIGKNRHTMVHCRAFIDVRSSTDFSVKLWRRME